MTLTKKLVWTIAVASWLGAGAALRADHAATAVKQADDGSVKLLAGDAKISGGSARLEGVGDDRNIGYWDSTDITAKWAMHFDKPGVFRVQVTYSLDANFGGSEISIAIGDQTLTFKPKALGTWGDYQTEDIGEVRIDKPADATLVLQATQMPADDAINVKRVTLRPPFPQGADGSIKLPASAVSISGAGATLEGHGDSCNVGNWDNTGVTLSWPITVDKPGAFSVEITCSLDPTCAGSEVSVTIGDQKLTFKPKAGDWATYNTVKVGEVHIDKAGEAAVVLQATQFPGPFVLNVRTVAIIPTTAP